MNNVFIIVYSILKNWMASIYKNVSMLKFVSVLVLTILLSGYYVQCYRPQQYSYSMLGGTKNYSIALSNISLSINHNYFIYNRNIRDTFACHYTIGEKKNQFRDSIDLLIDEVRSAKWDRTCVYESYYFVSSKGLTTIGIPHPHLYIPICGAHDTVLFTKALDDQMTAKHIEFTRDKEVARNRLIVAFPSWLLRGNLSQVKLTFHPQFVNYKQAPPSIKIQFDELVKPSLIFPEPDSVWNTGFAYTDPNKTDYICQNGMSALCEFPSMEGWQLARVFILTTLLSALITLLMTMLYTLVRRKRDVLVWFKYILYTILWIVIIYFVYAIVYHVLFSFENWAFVGWLTVVTILVSYLSYRAASRFLENNDVTFLPMVDHVVVNGESVPYPRGLHEVFHVLLLVLPIAATGYLLGHFVWKYPSFGASHIEKMSWCILTTATFVIGLLIPLAKCYGRNHRVMFQQTYKAIATWITSLPQTGVLFVRNHRTAVSIVGVVVCLLLAVTGLWAYGYHYTSRQYEKCSTEKDFVTLYDDWRSQCNPLKRTLIRETIWSMCQPKLKSDMPIEALDCSMLDGMRCVYSGTDYEIRRFEWRTATCFVRTNLHTMKSDTLQLFSDFNHNPRNVHPYVSPDGYTLYVELTEGDTIQGRIIWRDKRYDLDRKFEWYHSLMVCPYNALNVEFVGNDRLAMIVNHSLLICDLNRLEEGFPYCLQKIGDVDRVWPHGYGLLYGIDSRGWICTYCITPDNKCTKVRVGWCGRGCVYLSKDQKILAEILSSDVVCLYRYTKGQYELLKEIKSVGEQLIPRAITYDPRLSRLWILASDDRGIYTYYVDYESKNWEPQFGSFVYGLDVPDNFDPSKFDYSARWGLYYVGSEKSVFWGPDFSPLPYIASLNRSVFPEVGWSNNERMVVKEIPQLSWEEVYEFAKNTNKL